MGLAISDGHVLYKPSILTTVLVASYECGYI